jgi:hypothetical protein
MSCHTLCPIFVARLRTSTRMLTVLRPLPVMPKYPGRVGITIEGENEKTKGEDVRRTA